MRELCHVVRFVKFSGIDFVYALWICFSLLKAVSDAVYIRLSVAERTVPSSHWTISFPPSNSSTTQPRTKAVLESLSQTYLFPEKSFSPSMPRIRSVASCISSDLINCGAKVPGDAALLRCEFDLRRVTSPFPFREKLPNCDEDWLREWLICCEPGNGEVIKVDFGRGFTGTGPGEGDGELLVKGLFRHFGPLAALIFGGVVAAAKFKKRALKRL